MGDICEGGWYSYNWDTDILIDSREKGYRIFVSGLSRHYRKIFEISGLTRYTTIVESEDEIIGEEEPE